MQFEYYFTACTEENKSTDEYNPSSKDNVIATDIQTDTTIETDVKVMPEPVIPSAPAIDDIELTGCDKIQTTIQQYPDLSKMKLIENKTISGLKEKSDEKITTKPFNEMQLKELYYNPELLLADSFETEFIQNELSCTYKEHPLYDLIKKYSQNRYNLKINILDLQGYIKAFQQNSKNVWTIENRMLNYEGTCQDGERIRKTEYYE